MKSVLILLLALVFPQLSFAQYAEMAVIGGIQTTDVDTDVANTEVDGGSGFFAGLMGYMELGEGGFLRSGAVLNQRQWEVSGTDLEFETLNLDVPLTYMYKVNDIVGVFGGFRLGLNISDDCSPAVCDADPETVYYAAEVGGHFHFAPDFGVEAVFNFGLSELAQDLEWKNSLMAGVFYIF